MQAGKLKGLISTTFRPYHHRCSYCDVSYDVIGFMEDFDNDFDYIVEKMNLTKLKGQTEYVANPSKDSDMSQEKRIASYFSMLTDDTKKRLYELYKVDFEMFGYDGRRHL